MVKSIGPDRFALVLDRLPDSARAYTASCLQNQLFLLKITNPRRVRLGSFRAAPRGGVAQITINNDLGPFSFLLVLLHELAHHLVWKHYGRKVAPHGKEWKAVYADLLIPLLEQHMLPESLEAGLLAYLRKTSATFQSCKPLLSALNLLEGKGEMLTLADINDQDSFRLQDGRIMIRHQKLRTRYKCYYPANKRYYLVPASVQIFMP